MKNESRVKKTLLNAKINLICYFVSFITAFFTRKVLLDNLGAEFIGFTGTVGSLQSFLNLPSLAGAYGKQVKKRAEWLLKNGLYTARGSDLHCEEGLEYILSPANSARNR